jgi:hypothetical protein
VVFLVYNKKTQHPAGITWQVLTSQMGQAGETSRGSDSIPRKAHQPSFAFGLWKQGEGLFIYLFTYLLTYLFNNNGV